METPPTASPEWDPSAYVWLSDSHEGFVRAQVLSRDPSGSFVVVRPEGSMDDVRAELDRGPALVECGTGAPKAQAAAKKDQAPVLFAEKMNPPHTDGCEDMSQLCELNESGVLNNLRARYAATRIHTYSGLFLVVVNPYCALPVYSEAVTRMYEGRRRDEVAPHVFAVADEAYRMMVANKKNQSILITGESGAGKTENTKRVIQYYATVCRRQDKQVGQLEEQMLQANPILEAFGNAKTMRNDNSSRFGKFIQIQFTSNGLVSGMKTVHYLLERSRICSRLKGERSFHIFYQLLAGASPEQRASLKLLRPSDYEYLRAGDCYAIDGVDDTEMFSETKSAMSIFGITDDQQNEIFRLISAILWLGNIRFEDTPSEEAVVPTREALQNAAEVLGLPVDALELGLLKKKITAGGQTLVTSQKAAMASASRDALARALYDKLFDWLVRTINQTISHDGRSASFVGVLDIAGFEIFETNSFEQLCINFTNEKLQQFFNHHMFVREQEEYAAEKIEWTHQDFGNLLKETIDAIEHPTNGILAALEEQCFLPSGKKEAFLSKIYATFGKGCASFNQPRTSNTQFGLKHYAGWVTYTVDDWLARNKSPLHDDLVDATRQSTVRLVQQLFTADANAAAIAASRKGKSASMETVSSQFRSQLSTLMTTLSQTEPHFIRCIKPNHERKPWVINGTLVLDQLRCNGVLEGIRISRMGFPLRVPLLEFVKRFRVLAPRKQAVPGNLSAASEAILSATPLRKMEDYQLGTTKVFMRCNKNTILENLRNEVLSESARQIQRAWRRFHFVQGYSRWREQHSAAKVIQRNTAMWLAASRRSWTRLFLLATSNAALSKQVGSLKSQVQEMEDRNAQTRDNAESAMRGKDREIQELQERCNRLVADLDRVTAEKIKTAGVLSVANDRLVDYEEVSQSESRLQRELAAAKKENERLAQAHAKAERTVKQHEARMADMGASIARDQKQSTVVSQQVEELKMQIDEQISTCMRLQEDLEASAAENESLRQRISRERSEKEKAERQAHEFKELLEKAAADEKSTRSSLECSLNDSAASVASLTEGLAKERATAKRLDIAKKQLDTELAATVEMLEQARERAASLEARVSELEQLSEDLVLRLETEARLKEDLQNKCDALEAKISDLKWQLEESAGKQQSVKSLIREKQVLREQIVEETSLREAAEKSLQSVSTELSQLKEKARNSVDQNSVPLSPGRPERLDTGAFVEEQIQRERTLQSTLEGVRAELTAARGKAKQLEETLAKETRLRDVKVHSWMAQADRLSKENAVLTEKLNNLRAYHPEASATPTPCEAAPVSAGTSPQPCEAPAEVDDEVARNVALKLLVHNVAQSAHGKQVEREFKRLGVAYAKLRKPQGHKVATVWFASAEDKAAAIPLLEGYAFKNQKWRIEECAAANEKKRQRIEAAAAGGPAEKRHKGGAAPMSAVPYEKQLRDKYHAARAAARDAWAAAEGLGNAPELDGGSVYPSPSLKGYRNKLSFTIGNTADGSVCVGFAEGLVARGVTTVVPPEPGLLVSERAEEIRLAMQRVVAASPLPVYNKLTHKGFWRTLEVRAYTTGEVMATVQYSDDKVPAEAVAEAKAKVTEELCGNTKVTSLRGQVNNSVSNACEDPSVLWHGEECVHERILGILFRISSGSFFQVNSLACEKLYGKVRDWCVEIVEESKAPQATLLDVCCGTGTIGQVLASHFGGGVVGIDISEAAILDARANAQLNGSNARYYAGKAEQHMPEVVRECNEKGGVCVAVVDPPRGGLHPSVLKALRSCSGLVDLVYVSCNPRTLASDAKSLCTPQSKAWRGEPFAPVRVAAFDMFPYTDHVEMVMHFRRRPQTRFLRLPLPLPPP
eukprot:m51a1_g10934 putative myosin ii heavy chain (1856) ;mRNA; r:146368-154726